jgi:periplasmic copper chaperone A
MSRKLGAFIVSALVSTALHAAGGVTVGDPHVRLVPPTAENSGVFMLLRNDSDKDVKLLGAESPASKKVELHTVVKEGEVMKMRPVPEIVVKAKGETALKPGGFHVMLIGLKQPLKEGEEVPVTLKFDDGSSQELKAPVRPINAPHIK